MLFSETANGNSGIPRYVKAIAKGITDLKPKDIELKLAVRSLKSVPNLDSMNLKYFYNPIQGKIQNIIRRFKNGEQLLFGKADIVHEPNYNFLSFSRKTRKILTVHDVGWKLNDISYGLTKEFIKNAEKSIKSADKIITPTETVKKDVIRFYGLNPEIITVIPHGIDPVFLSSEATNMKSTLPEEYWLFVGALTARKNIERVIDSLASMTHKIPLVIVGKKSIYAEELIKSAETKSVEVIVVSDADDQELKEIYKKSKGLVYPSYWEGFGLPIVEAASAGIPIITSNNTAMKEIGEGYAYLIEPFNTGDIVTALKEVLDMDPSKREHLKMQGMELAKKYTWKQSVQLHLNVYKSL